MYILNACGAGEKLQAALRSEAFRALLCQRVEFFDRHSSSQLTQLLSRDLDSIRTFVFANTARDRGLRALLEATGTVGVLFTLRCGAAAVAAPAPCLPAPALANRGLPARPPLAAGGWAPSWRASLLPLCAPPSCTADRRAAWRRPARRRSSGWPRWPPPPSPTCAPCASLRGRRWSSSGLGSRWRARTRAAWALPAPRPCWRVSQLQRCGGGGWELGHAVCQLLQRMRERTGPSRARRRRPSAPPCRRQPQRDAPVTAGAVRAGRAPGQLPPAARGGAGHSDRLHLLPGVCHAGRWGWEGGR